MGGPGAGDGKGEGDGGLGRVFAWRPATEAAEAAEGEERFLEVPVDPDALPHWLSAGHPLAAGGEPELLLYASRRTGPGDVRRSLPHGILALETGAIRPLDRMPAGLSPDEHWLSRDRFGRFELRDRDDETVWSFQAIACTARWRAERPGD